MSSRRKAKIQPLTSSKHGSKRGRSLPFAKAGHNGVHPEGKGVEGKGTK